MLTLNFFGEMQALKDGEPVALPASKKARALLAYLSVTGRAQGRAQLCSLLWELPDDPRGALRWSLSKLRGVVNEQDRERIKTDRESVAFDPLDAEIDVLQVKALAARGLDRLDNDELAQLAELMRGEFLQGLDMTNCHEFFTWHVAEQEDFRQLKLRALATLIDRLGAATEEALPHARALAQADPYSVEVRLQLIDALRQTGHAGEAEQHYQAGLRILSELSPDAVAALEQGWTSQKPAQAPKAPTVSPPPASPNRIKGTDAIDQFGRPIAAPLEMSRDASGELIGRADALAALDRAYEAVRETSKSSAFVVLGEPGMGKSRLVAEFEKGLLEKEHVLISASCHEMERTRAYGIWIDALRHMGAADQETSPYRPIYELMTRSVDEPLSDPNLENIYAEITQLISDWDGVTPIALSIDDVQWIDEASAKLVLFIAREHRNNPVFILGAAREGELPDNIAASMLMRELRRETKMEEVRLGPLAEADQAKLVHALNPDADLEKVSAASGGNLFLMTELARLPNDAEMSTAPSVRALVESHAAALPPTALTVLNWCAVTGIPLRVNQTAYLMGVDELEVADALEVLVRRSIMVERLSQGGDLSRFQFRHDVYRSAVYAAISGPRRQVMHLKMAQAMDEIYGEDETLASRVAFHAIRGGDAVLAANACIRAGRRCLRLFASNDAYAMAERVLSFSARLTPVEKVRAKIAAHEIRYFARRKIDHEGLEAEIEQLADEALSQKQPDYARRAYQLVAFLRWEAGDFGRAQQNATRATIAARSSDPKQQIIALSEAARCLVLLERDLSEAETLTLEAAALAKQDGFRPFTIPLSQGMLRNFQGEVDQAEKHFDEALMLADQSADWLGKFQTLEQATALELHRGNIERAEFHANQLLAVGEKFREGSELVFAKAVVALIRCAKGEEESCVALDEAANDLRISDAKLRLAFIQCRAARFNFAEGRIEMALARAEEALGAAMAIGRSTEIAMARAILAEIYLAAGSDKNAKSQLKALEAIPAPELSYCAQQERARVLDLVKAA